MITRMFSISAAALLAMSMATTALAGWEAEPDGFNDKFWRVTNTETGQQLVKVYKSKRQAKKAAKALNKGDKSVMAGPDGEGDFQHGGELPK